VIDAETLRAVYFELGWHSFGGIGLGWSPRDCDEVAVGDLLRYYDDVVERRAAEYSALSKAPSGGPVDG